MEFIEVRVPQLSEAVGEASLLYWQKRVGEPVLEGDVLAFLESDKVSLEVPASIAGVLVSVLKDEGDKVTSGDVIALIDPAPLATSVEETYPSNGSSESTTSHQGDASSPGERLLPSSALNVVTLVIQIDGKWSARDFSEFFRAVDNMYVLFVLMQIERIAVREMQEHRRSLVERAASGGASESFMKSLISDPNLDPMAQLLLRPDDMDDRPNLLRPDERLQVLRCRYASPGSFDFAGIGAGLGQIKDFLLALIQREDDKPKRALEAEAAAEANRHQKQMNVLAEQKMEAEVHKFRAEAMVKQKMLEQELIAVCLKNVRDSLDIQKNLVDSGHSASDAKNIVSGVAPDTEILRRLVFDGKVTDARMLGENDVTNREVPRRES